MLVIALSVKVLLRLNASELALFEFKISAAFECLQKKYLMFGLISNK